MNNQELELKEKEILENKNFFDMEEATIVFEKEYKGTEFYKKTKMSLIDVIKESKIWYALQFEDVGNKIQNLINNLDLSNINNILEQLGDVYSHENTETLNILKEFKDIVK